MSDSESIKCPICLFPFDADKHLPKISPTCGHTVCKECLLQVLQMGTPKCPLDKLRFGRDFRTIDAFPTNFLGKDLLEMEGKWNKCEAHKEKTKMICLTDNTLVCGACVIFGDHKGHDIKMLSDFEGLVQQKKNQLSAVAEKISKVSSEFTSLLEEKKQNMKSTIKDRFQALRLEIAKQEVEMLLKFENIFIDEKTNLNNMINASLEMPFDIESKLKEFNDVMLNPNIVKLTQEDYSDLGKLFDEKVTAMEAKHTEEISELLAVFQSSLPKEDVLKDFNIIDPLNQELTKLSEKRRPAQNSQLVLQIKEVILPPVKLVIFESDDEPDVLDVQGSESLKSSKFSTAQLEKIKEINYEFQFEEDTIDETTLPSIMLLSKFLKNLKIVRVDIETSSYFEGDCDRPFWQLLSAAFSQLPSLENIEEIDIEVKNAPLGDLGFICMAEMIIPRLKNLKTFSCTLDKTHTTSKALKALSKVDFSKCSDLQKFHVDIKRCPLNEDGVVEFLNRVPNVKDVLLGFGAANSLTDKAFDSFSTSVLPLLDKVETFEVGLWETNITNEGVKKLLNHIPNVKNLYIGLNSTRITDEALAGFVNHKIPTMTNLKGLDICLDHTDISGALMEAIIECEDRFNGDTDDEEEAEAEAEPEDEAEAEGEPREEADNDDPENDDGDNDDDVSNE